MDVPNRNFFKADIIPLLAEFEGEQCYFVTDAFGHVSLFLQAQNHWELKSQNLFARQIGGFEAAFDRKGNLKIMSYDNEGRIFYLNPLDPAADVKILYEDPTKTITFLSCSFDADNRLHVLHRAVDQEKLMWWLFYHRYEQGKKPERSVLDYGYYPTANYGSIFSDPQNNINTVYCRQEGDNFRLTWDKIDGISGRLDKKTGFPGTGLHPEPYTPTFLLDRDNIWHTTWISQEQETFFLNYAGRNTKGEWKNFQHRQVSENLLYLVPLYFTNKQLYMVLANEKGLTSICSHNGGSSWDESRELLYTRPSKVTRLRSHRFPAHLQYTGITYVYTINIPPKVTLYPGLLQSSNKGEKKENLNDHLRSLDLLSSYFLNHSKELYKSQTSLQEKLEKTKKELTKVREREMTKVQELEKILADKNIALDQAEELFKKKLLELQSCIEDEKEKLTIRNQELLNRIAKNEREKERLREENAQQMNIIKQLEEQLMDLRREKNMTLSTKNKGFFSRLFKKD